MPPRTLRIQGGNENILFSLMLGERFMAHTGLGEKVSVTPLSFSDSPMKIWPRAVAGNCVVLDFPVEIELRTGGKYRGIAQAQFLLDKKTNLAHIDNVGTDMHLIMKYTTPLDA